MVPTIPLTLSSGAKPEETYRQALKAQPPKSGVSKHAASEGLPEIVKDGGRVWQNPGHAR